MLIFKISSWYVLPSCRVEYTYKRELKAYKVFWYCPRSIVPSPSRYTYNETQFPYSCKRQPLERLLSYERLVHAQERSWFLRLFLRERHRKVFNQIFLHVRITVFLLAYSLPLLYPFPFHRHSSSILQLLSFILMPDIYAAICTLLCKITINPHTNTYTLVFLWLDLESGCHIWKQGTFYTRSVSWEYTKSGIDPTAAEMKHMFSYTIRSPLSTRYR